MKILDLEAWRSQKSRRILRRLWQQTAAACWWSWSLGRITNPALWGLSESSLSALNVLSALCECFLNTLWVFLKLVWAKKTKIESLRQVRTKRTDRRTCGLLGLPSELKTHYALHESVFMCKYCQNRFTKATRIVRFSIMRNIIQNRIISFHPIK